MSHDQYFTPVALADAVVSALTLRKVRLIADFAAGHGELLSAVHRRWKSSHLLGCDIDPECVRQFTSTKKCSGVTCDFLNATSRAANKHLATALGQCDAVVLNPPFSGRGATAATFVTSTGVRRCSRAMAFFIASIPYLRRDGQLVAILPASSITSIKDGAAREYLASQGRIEIVRELSRGAFSDCAARTTLIRFHRGAWRSEPFKASPTGRRRRYSTIRAKLVRGCIPVYRAENGLAGTEWPFLHSTDLRSGEIDEVKRFVHVGNRAFTGPAVVIARVGSPAAQKCALYLDKTEVTPSDCIVAITCSSQKDAIQVRRRMHQHWPTIEAAYGGTCAPYITMAAISRTLRRLGIETTDGRAKYD